MQPRSGFRSSSPGDEQGKGRCRLEGARVGGFCYNRQSRASGFLERPSGFSHSVLTEVASLEGLVSGGSCAREDAVLKKGSCKHVNERFSNPSRSFRATFETTKPQPQARMLVSPWSRLHVDRKSEVVECRWLQPACMALSWFFHSPPSQPVLR